MKLKELLNNETFLSKYGDYEIVGDSYTTVRQNDKSQLVFDIQKPKPKSIWDLESGDKYFILYADGAVTEYEWIKDGYISKNYRDQGNVFLTKEEAEKDAERREVETLLLKHGGRRWFKKYEWNYYLSFNTDLKVLVAPCTRVDYRQGAIYFDSEKQAKKAIGEIGDERIRKALFEVR